LSLIINNTRLSLSKHCSRLLSYTRHR